MLRYFDECILCKVYSINPFNVFTNFEINLYKIDEVRKHAKIVIYFTSRDPKTVRRTSWGLDTPDRYFHKSYGSNSGLNVFDDLDLDLSPRFYWLSH